MNPYPILEFIQNNPITALFISVPVGLTIVACSWVAASMLNSAYTSTLNLFIVLLDFFKVIIRGYPKSSKGDELIKKMIEDLAKENPRERDEQSS